MNADAPIFVLGISQRSGTNFLYDLIVKHPACAGHPTVWEDFLVEHSDQLDGFVDNIHRHWEWKDRSSGFSKDELCRLLGDALLGKLAGKVAPKRLVTKTPSVVQIQRYPRFFGHCPLLILVRDGRAVVESRVKTFHESYESATRHWAEAADQVLEFQKHHKPTEVPYRIVRYEDLYQDVETTLRGAFELLGLDPEVYDYETAADLPVRGSSVFRGKEQDDVNWKPVPRDAAFDPTRRFRHWGRGQHEQFNRLAGEQLGRLGYEPRSFQSNRLWWALWMSTMGLRRMARQVLLAATVPPRWLIKTLIGRERAARLRRRWESRGSVGP